MEHVMRNRAQCGDAQPAGGAERTEATSPQASFL